MPSFLKYFAKLYVFKFIIPCHLYYLLNNQQTPGSKTTSSGRVSGTTSPALVTPPVVEPSPGVSVEDPLVTANSVPAPSPTTTALGSEASLSTPEATVNGSKFTTSNFVESVVTPSGSVFGESGKSTKKRKSQTKDDSPVQQQTSSNSATSAVEELKRLKIDPGTKTETPTPSVVVKAPATTPSTSPNTTQPVSRPPATSK